MRNLKIKNYEFIRSDANSEWRKFAKRERNKAVRRYNKIQIMENLIELYDEE